MFIFYFLFEKLKLLKFSGGEFASPVPLPGVPDDPPIYFVVATPY